MLNKLHDGAARSLRVALLVIVPAFMIGGCGGDNPTAPLTPGPQTLEEELSGILASAVGPKTPGVTLRVLGDGIDISLAAGVASLATQEQLTTAHRFHAASVGKSFIGVAFARLSVAGQLDPGRPLSTWLPAEITGRIPLSDQITARMLLQHTSGIVDVLNEMHDAIIAIELNPTREWSNVDLVQFALDKPLNFAPGSAYRYSNTNYMLLALILEKVTGETHAQALRDLVFDPIGMTSTTTANHDANLGAITRAHMFEGDDHDDLTDVLLRWEFGSGGQWTTVDDLARFLHTVGETDLILDDAGRALLLTPSAHQAYGFGMGFTDTPGGLMLHHQGLLLGSASYMSYFPERRLSVTMNVNAAAHDDDGVMIADKLFLQVMVAINE